MTARYTVLTFIMNGYEVVREVEEKDPEAEYLLITDDEDLKSDSWTVIYDPSLDGLSPWAKCCAVRYNCFRYANTDICVRVDGSIKVKRSLKPLIDRFEEGHFDLCLMPNPTFFNFLDEYEYWIKNRQYPREQAERCISIMKEEGYDFNYKGYFQIGFGVLRKNATTQSINKDILQELYKWSGNSEPERLDQVPFSYILNAKYSDVKILPVSEQIICSAYLQIYGHNATEPSYLKPFDISKDDYQYLFNKKVKCEYILAPEYILKVRITELWQAWTSSIRKKEEEVRIRDLNIATKEKTIETKEEEIATKDKIIAEKDRQIEDLNAVINTKRIKIKKKNRIIRYICFVLLIFVLVFFSLFIWYLTR